MSSRSINDVLQAHTPTLLAIPGVVGTGVGEEAGKPCLLVLVRKKNASLLRQVPAELDGYRVKIEEVGDVRALEPK